MESALVDQASEQFLGQWKRLVSTTNWEKGRIIHEWREALQAAGAPVSEYSDDAWSRRVGNVTPQHVGRLRRVFERFAATHEDYDGLFWSHFQAALDWDDAEMWLEGAVQSDWSISEMRYKRWETHGAVAAEQPDANVPEMPWDDDADASESEVATGALVAVSAPAGEVEDEDGDGEAALAAEDRQAEAFVTTPAPEVRPSVRPFAALPPLPTDVNDAFESYKLCILRHKLAGWQEITCGDMVASLEALVQLALAPADV